MSNPCKCILTILALALLAAPAAAQKEVVVRQVDDPGSVVSLQAGAFRVTDGYQVGNLNPPFWLVNDFIYGLEGYKFLFYPREQNLPCPGGFLLNTVHFLINFGEEDIPVGAGISFDVHVDLEDALWDPASGCWSPGPEDCVSGTYEVAIPAPGLYDVAIPIDCQCAYLDYWYMLSVHFDSLFPETMRPDLVTDDFPSLCTSWNDYGAGWYDLRAAYPDFPGNIVIWGDVTCCDDPVAGDEATWGSMKSLFR